MILLALLAGLWGFAAPQPVASQASTLSVTLELAPDAGLLVNRLNPPEVSLTSPWEASPLPAAVSGEAWAEQPEVYFSRVNPVQWTLNVPAGTPPGQYKAAVSVKLGLCKKADGFCFIREAEQMVSLEVPDTLLDTAQTSFNETSGAKVTLKFHAPSF